MAAPVRFTIGAIELCRVEYFDVALDPESVSLTAAQVASVPSAVPTWATEVGQVLVGQAMWVLRSAGTTIVVDPCGASDAFLRTGPEAITHQNAMLAALVEAGFGAEDVDVVLLSHLDGIGLVAVVDDAGAWAPTFPNARVVVPAEHLAFLASDAGEGVSGSEAFAVVQRFGVVDGVPDGHEVAPGVVLQVTGAHAPGHAVIRVGQGDGQGVMVGHLAVSPLHAMTGPCAGLNDDPQAAWSVLGALVTEAEDRRGILIGPLWPRPGAGSVVTVDGVPTIIPIGSPAACSTDVLHSAREHDDRSP